MLIKGATEVYQASIFTNVDRDVSAIWTYLKYIVWVLICLLPNHRILQKLKVFQTTFFIIFHKSMATENELKCVVEILFAKADIGAD